MVDDEPGWLHNKWRPVTAWAYLLICIFDFMGAPLLLAASQETMTKMIDWHPMTLQGGGLFHIAMLTIIGVTAYGRTQEKITAIQTQLTTKADG